MILVIFFFFLSGCKGSKGYVRSEYQVLGVSQAPKPYEQFLMGALLPYKP